MAEQKAGGFGNRYKFNGKELDALSGLYYYGARFYDPVVGNWLSADPLTEKYPSLSPYNFVANNPLIYIDPDGRTIIPVHGTWSDRDTWEDLNGIKKASSNLFNDNHLGSSFPWSGGNYAASRTEAAFGLIDFVRTEMKSKSFNGEITLVGHSHGGNVSIEALNMIVEMKEFDNVQLNLLTINTPVREDYQLSEKAAERVNHVNVYDPKDPVQANGGNAVTVSPRQGDPHPSGKGWGEYGSAGRVFENARNIQVNNPQGALKTLPTPIGMLPRVSIGDFHNSHNRVSDWINKTENK